LQFTAGDVPSFIENLYKPNDQEKNVTTQYAIVNTLTAMIHSWQLSTQASFNSCFRFTINGETKYVACTYGFEGAEHFVAIGRSDVFHLRQNLMEPPELVPLAAWLNAHRYLRPGTKKEVHQCLNKKVTIGMCQPRGDRK
jgi:hypothetical protein